MAKCAIEAEQTLNYRRLYNDIKSLNREVGNTVSTAEAVASSAVSAQLDLGLKLIIVITENGKIAQLTAKYRPAVPIFAATANQTVYNQFNTIRGVQGLKLQTTQGIDTVVAKVIAEA